MPMRRGQRAGRSRNSGFVSQYALHTQRDILGSAETRYRIGRRPGVYALYSDYTLYYVGLSRDVERRLRNHLDDAHGHNWDNFSVFLLTDDAEEHVRDLEAVLHRIYKPAGNKSVSKFQVGKDLSKILRGIKPVPGGSEFQKYALAGRVAPGTSLRLRYKGRVHKARVTLKGTILFRGVEYESPSSAAAAAMRRGAAANGWYWWEHERGPGAWERLKELRNP